MQTLKIGIQRKKEIYCLFGYEKAPVGGSKKTFERKLTECCNWNTDSCKTTEINVIEIYKQPNETAFEHGLKGNTNNKGKVSWHENSNSKFVAEVLLNKIEYFQREDKNNNQFITIKTLAKRCGFETDDLETANNISKEIKRNINKLEKINLIKVEKKYNACQNKNFIEISEEDYLKFKEVSKKVWSSLDMLQTKKFRSFYQFKALINDSYIESVYLEELSKETSITYVFESYKLSLIESEENNEKIAEFTEMLFDDDMTVQEKIDEYITEKEEYFKQKAMEKQEENKYTPSGFGDGFLWYTKTLATANNAVVF